MVGIVAQAGPIKKVPVRITKPGKYYLIANVTPSQKAAAEAVIVIDANDVELDLQGFSIVANPDNPTVTVGVSILGKEGIRVRNGRIRGFDWGIYGGNESRDVLFEGLEIKSSATAAECVSKGSHFRNCSFILGAAIGAGLRISSSGGGPAHIVEGCTFYATAQGVAMTQQAVAVGGQQPTIIRQCQFIGFGLGISGNNITTAADNVFQSCLTKFDAGVSNLVGYNQ